MILHPFFVHFPIAFFLLESVLLSIWLWRREEVYRRFARLIFIFGFVVMLPALASGLYDADGLSGAFQRPRNHFLSALASFIVVSFRLVHGQIVKTDRPVDRMLQIGGSVLTSVLILLTGYLGGLLVHGEH